MRNNW